MRLPTSEFIRRFLIHVLPSGFRRIRRDRIAKIRSILEVEADAIPQTHEDQSVDTDERDQSQPCPKCGGATMIITKTFMRGQTPKSRAPPWEGAA